MRGVTMSDWPGRRRSSSNWMSSALSEMPGGQPSMMTPTPPPWDSPKVWIRKAWPKLEDMRRSVEMPGLVGSVDCPEGEPCLNPVLFRRFSGSDGRIGPRNITKFPRLDLSDIRRGRLGKLDWLAVRHSRGGDRDGVCGFRRLHHFRHLRSLGFQNSIHRLGGDLRHRRSDHLLSGCLVSLWRRHSSGFRSECGRRQVSQGASRDRCRPRFDCR